MRHELCPENIWKFKAENKLTKKDTLLIMEAYRRKHFLATKNGWLGLGTPSQYASRYFTTVHGVEIPRCSNWYKLTNEGKAVLEKMESYFAEPTDFKERDIDNLMIFSLY